jgi:peptidoglycan/LPS O-acetylase OafA/YrhL
MRLRSLDGLRGIAAAIVVLHHSALLNPGVSAVYLTGAAPASGTFAAIIIRTPLQLLFSGQEAVLVFFVLSGLVVAIPALDTVGFPWIAYYPRRVVRLLLPVVASVLLAAILIRFTQRDPSTAVSGWAAEGTFAQLDWRELLRNFDVLGGSNLLNNPLWSLRYELLFSVLLPLYIVIAVVARRRWWIAVVATVPAILLGGLIGDGVWVYLPVFLLGTLAAVRREDLARFVDRVPHRARNVVGAGSLAVGLLLLDARWIGAAVRPGSATGQTIGGVASVYGATLLVVLAMVWSPLVRALEVRFVAWLGRISFSLYLVHVPILVATSSVMRGLPWYWSPVVGIPISIAVAVVFARFVEGPSHRLSQRIGRAIDARFPVSTASGARHG